MARLFDLSRLVFEHAERDEVEEACGGYSEQHVLRFLLTKEPYYALLELVGRRRRLRIIAEELGIESSKVLDADKNKIVQLILSKILPNESGEPQLSGFFVLQKSLSLANSLPSSQRYDKVSRLVNTFELLVKNLYKLYRVEVLPRESDEYLLKDILPLEKHYSLNKTIAAMERLEQRIVNNKALQEACEKLLLRNKVFPDIDFGMLREFARLRNRSFGHRESYYVPPIVESSNTTEMIQKLYALCSMFQRVAPKVIVQVHYTQDHFARHRVYYIEEEHDFDENGSPKSTVYDREARAWNLNLCRFYCSAITLIGSYRPGAIAYLLPRRDDIYPFIAPDIHDANDLSRISVTTITAEPGGETVHA